MEKIIEFVKSYFSSHLYDPSHDFCHVQRVVSNAQLIAHDEESRGNAVDLFVVTAAAYLHDVGDYKYAKEGSKSQCEVLREFLLTIKDEISSERREMILDIVSNMGFKSELSHGIRKEKSLEFQIVQDADRLDALGAIGIARCFSFGAMRNRPFFDPEHSPKQSLTAEQYTNKNTGASIDHFYEKLFLLKDRMNTNYARQLAESRHEVMVEFVEQFKREWSVIQINDRNR